MAILIKATGEVQMVEPKDGETFSEEELKGYVGRYVTEQAGNGDVLVLNTQPTEPLPRNAVATDRYSNELYGDVLVCSPQQIA